MNKTVLLVLILALSVSLMGCDYVNEDDLADLEALFIVPEDSVPVVVDDAVIAADGVSLASWNLQIFGTTKAGKPEVMSFYQEKLNSYDLVFVQEIRDSSDTAFWELCALFPGYDCLVSQRDGRSSSQEQTGVLFNPSKVNVVEFSNIADPSDVWERSPTLAKVAVDNVTFDFYVVHLKPDDVASELFYLEQIVSSKVVPVVIIGDLNADCTYYKPEVHTEFDTWNWIIGDSQDTTTASTDCAYDRIIANDLAVPYISSVGVDSSGINKTFSDHYLINAKVIV